MRFLKSGAFLVVLASLLTATAAQARFLQTDPVGYKDGPDWYLYVGDDPLNHTDPTGLTCQGSGDKLSCHIDKVTTPNNRPLTSAEKAQVAAFNKAYTAAVKTLSANPGGKAQITVGGKTFEVKSGDLAKTLSGRTFEADVGRAGTAGTGQITPTSPLTTFLYKSALEGTVGPASEHGDVDREITTVHEGIHRSAGEKSAFPDVNHAQPTIADPHGARYDDAARSLLGIPPN